MCARFLFNAHGERAAQVCAGAAADWPEPVLGTGCRACFSRPLKVQEGELQGGQPTHSLFHTHTEAAARPVPLRRSNKWMERRDDLASREFFVRTPIKL